MKKRGVNTSNSKVFLDEEFHSFKGLLNRLKIKHSLSSVEIINMIESEILVPTTIFNDTLSPLETTTKYLKENLKLEFPKIGKILGRDRKTVWQAYKNSKKKFPQPIVPADTEFNLPVSLFCSKLSILEASATYLKDNFNLSFHQIGALLQRSEKTVWTVYNRGLRKNEE